MGLASNVIFFLNTFDVDAGTDTHVGVLDESTRGTARGRRPPDNRGLSLKRIGGTGCSSKLVSVSPSWTATAVVLYYNNWASEHLDRESGYLGHSVHTTGIIARLPTSGLTPCSNSLWTAARSPSATSPVPTVKSPSW